MPKLIPVNLHESAWGPQAENATIWARELAPEYRKQLATLAVARAAALGSTILNGEESGLCLDIPSPPSVVDSRGRRGWVLTSLEEPEQPIAIEWRIGKPDDSRDVWITSLCGHHLSEVHNYIPPQS